MPQKKQPGKSGGGIHHDGGGKKTEGQEFVLAQTYQVGMSAFGGGNGILPSHGGHIRHDGGGKKLRSNNRGWKQE